mmetsp:Transcript_23879/g.39477  ORF Transcript_23879/g.39477 Transcript_23879/m.39477 type:complete len:280 (-) Transcript_23879:996-1835(-)|eukprot:CAMPEP_0119006234 /NCGR_PEP_ID=MMETSP1176-20130426/2180_1 /TAXON_ID=265551 /ORGANISM="Synedropsis recta cf, Strain CCMP1620" /LENGTH=279 /DNA_ID=CAMNT_0006958127 /DNA_START=62 /DNA_END=901 /DNA_ORIENTATION=-
MTILGVPDGAGFALGTSANIAPSTGNNKMDMSLDDMIKTRRTSSRVKASTAKASTADKTVAKGRAKRQAAANNRRGLAPTKKPSAMDIEKEVYRQTRRSTSSTKKQATQPGRKPRTQADLKTKARQEKKKAGAKKGGKKQQDEQHLPPTWIGGTRRPPSKKAVAAAVDAMTDSGFKVPRGMQMVISFAPAPNQDPTIGQRQNNNNSKPRGGNNAPRGGNNNNNNNTKGKKQGGNSNNNSNNNNNNASKGGSRGGGRGTGGNGGGRGSGGNGGGGGGRRR